MRPKLFFLIPFLFVHLCSHAQQWTLEQCVGYATENNKSILSQEQDYRLRISERKAESSRLLPTIRLSGSADHYWKIPVQAFPGELLGQPAGSFVTLPTGMPYTGDIGVNAELKLIDVSAWKNIKIARIKEQIAAGESKSLMAIVRKNATIAYYAAGLQKEILSTTQQRYTGYVQTHRLISLQYDKGLTDKITLNQSSNILSERQQELSDAKAALETALIDLKFWMGYPFDNTLETISIDILPALSDMGFDIQKHPKYQSEQLKIELQKKNHSKSISALYPTLNVAAGYGQIGYSNDLSSFTRSANWNANGFVGLRLSIPIFSAHDYNRIRSEKIRMTASELRFLEYNNEQQRNFRYTHTYLEQAQSNVTLNEHKLILAMENETLSVAKIEKGIIDMTQLIQIQQELSGLHKQMYESKLNYLKHYVELIYMQSHE